MIEDNADLANMVRTFLIFEHHTVETIAHGGEARDHLKTFDYDLIVLDWELPEVSGIEILKDYRQRGGQAPVLMLTGKDDVSDKEAGLDGGADDYLTKPFHMKELGARVRSLLRRPAVVKETVLKAKNLTMDPSKYRVHKDGELVTLVPKEFQLLEFMMRHPNQVFTPEALLNRVWPSESDSTTEALRTTMKRLRKKVDEDGSILKTVHGVGYILELE
ncbi:MAG TPA: response regulator transcription factor [Candidatus Melainabacteria bacterium]|nr:response regulator transcription factor [Candidatus Melainabacteria bacterium]